ncbi:MAG: hypothetical protein VX598_01290 [Verrucomicrobiota bacterium]|nr:hypothetical protein [Verrucomicrobiota bacterium]|tara:strand:- start:29 stop:505 length:477 start_codon:yes stop_codon:yes gene_type:complete
MADINFDCPHCGQNLETDEILSGSGIDCPVCKKFLTIPGSAITIDLPPEPTNISTGENIADSLRATQLAARAARDSRAVLDQLAKRALKSVRNKDDLHIPTKNTQPDNVNLLKFVYEATNLTTGATEHGEISASNLADASNRLQKMGLEASSINQKKD